MDWKKPPTDGKLWVNKSLEIQINLLCNWTCIACDQFSQLTSVSFVKRGTMTIEQISRFCDEMIETNSYIGRIRLVGGEPSLHPKLPQILRLLQDRLVATGHIAQLEMVTNGSNDAKIVAAKRAPGLPDIPLRVRTSGEAAKQRDHTANLVNTPQSLGYQGKMCNAPWHCGMSLNFWGYFPCSSGAGIVRLRDLAGWQRLELPQGDAQPFQDTHQPLTVLRTWPNLQGLCDLCYHGLRKEDKIKCGTGSQPGQAELNAPGPEIKPHLDQWLQGKQATWKIYGQVA